MFDTNTLMIGILFGSFWIGYFIYWKKNRRSIPLLCGIILMIYPYFITDLLYLFGIWMFLMIIPLFIKVDF